MTASSATKAILLEEFNPLSATAGEDYVAASGTLTISAGDTTGTVDVEITDDDLIESALYEWFTVTLSNPSANAALVPELAKPYRPRVGVRIERGSPDGVGRACPKRRLSRARRCRSPCRSRPRTTPAR